MADLTLIQLKVWEGDATRAVTALQLPGPNRWSQLPTPALWIGPTQWLLPSEELAAVAIEKYSTALRDTLHALTDVSDMFTRFGLTGARARRLLGMGSSVDFDAAVFRSGHCVRTRLAKIAVVIRAMEGERFELFVDRSVAVYLESWMSAARQEPLMHEARG